MSDLVNAIQASNGGDYNASLAALQFLENAVAQNPAEFWQQMSQILSSDQVDEATRWQAGLYAKNLLSSRDDATLQQQHEAWMALDATVRMNVKNATFATLSGAAAGPRRAAAQLVAAIGAVEMPNQEWPELIGALLQGAAGTDNADLRKACLECLGYLCEELDRDCVSVEDTNNILSTICDALRAPATPDAIRESAMVALRNLFEFAETNFNTQVERDIIMTVVCESTQSQTENIRKVAYECFVKCVSLYYELMAGYMEVLKNLTLGAIRTDVEPVAMQAVEFWSTLAEEELEMAEEGRPELQNYTKAFLADLLPVLTEGISKQEEDADEQTWNVATASGTALGLVAMCVQNDIVQPLMPFISTNIKNADWRMRESATMSFGCIMEGPSSELLKPIIVNALPVIIEGMDDPVLQIRDTSIFTISRVCSFHAEALSPQLTQSVLSNLTGKLGGAEPKLAAAACLAIHNLADAADSEADTNILSPFYGVVVEALLATAVRGDANQCNLQTAAYEAVAKMAFAAASDCQQMLQQVVTTTMERLNAALQAGEHGTASSEVLNSVSSLCGVLHAAVQNMGEGIKLVVGNLMGLLLRALALDAANAHEDALLAIGEVASAIEGDFEAFLPQFMPMLEGCLQRTDQPHVCSYAVGAVGDLCRALNKRILPHAASLLNHVTAALGDVALNRDVKPPLLTCFGDVAMAIGGHFDEFLNNSMTYIFGAARKCAVITEGADDPEQIDYFNSLREAVLDACTGIVHGLAEDNRAEAFGAYVKSVIDFIVVLAQQDNKDEDVTTAAIGLIGDLCAQVGSGALQLMRADQNTVSAIMQLVTQGLQVSPKAAEVAQWTQAQLQQG